MRKVWRAVLDAVTPYEAGKPLADLAAELGLPDLVRLSANENPLGPSPRVVAAIAREATRVHLYPDGSAIITKPAASGGMVTFDTVREQLLYEVHDPSAYITPDVVVDMTTVVLDEVGPDRVQVSGTPQYLAPEDIRGRPLSGEEARRSDIHSLGVTLYELIAGRPTTRRERSSGVHRSSSSSSRSAPIRRSSCSTRRTATSRTTPSTRTASRCCVATHA